MNGNKLLLDTNIILYLLHGDDVLEDFLQGAVIYVSFITELELLSFKSFQTGEHIQIKQLLRQIKIIELSDDVKEIVKDIRARINIKLPDAIIAATSINLGIPL